MSSIENLIEHTNNFFNLHWPESLNRPRPEWKSDWNWQGSVPHHDKRGVYCLFDGAGDILYLGIGASVGGGKRVGFGISRRLLAHVITTDKTKGRGHYIPKRRWADVNSLAAIGFPNEYSYLALALEDYLIEKLSPPRNRSKKSRNKTQILSSSAKND
ncbi:GIY-YIG nuclease family protein [Salinimonas chungwhensis]|uniref:hypothetical protein n=1 Tax=Salinimonas chungwhensis TaxID=265425 RepID=UPI00037FD480|nr:hypothetical protein [Salinimonas chungwhensis]